MKSLRLAILIIFLPLMMQAKIFPIWKVRNFSVNDGLTQNTIYCIFQDSRGYIWTGTGDGLNLLNGNRIIRFRADGKDSCGLVHNAVRGIIEDKQENLIIGTEKGLSIFKNRRCFHNPASLLNKSIIPLTVTDNRALLWSQCEGLFWFDIKKESLTIADPDFNSFCKTNCVGLFSNQYLKPGELILKTSNGNFIFSINGGKAKPYVSENESHIYIDCDNTRWLFEAKGISRMGLNGNWDFISPFPDNFPFKFIKGITEADSSSILIGTYNSGIWMFDKTNQNIHSIILEGVNFSNRPSDLITCLFKDSPGNIWIGTDGNGLELFRPQENIFAHIHSIPWTNFNLGNEFCRSFLFLNDDILMISCFNNPLQAFDVKNFCFIPLYSIPCPPFKGLNINSMARYKDKVLIAGEDGLWSARFIITKDKVRLVNFKNISKKIARYLSIINDNEWIVNLEGEINHIQFINNEFRIVKRIQAWQWAQFSITGNSSITNNDIYITFNKDILSFSWPLKGILDTTKVFSLPDKVSKIFFIRSEENKRVIIGTNNGAYVYHNGSKFLQHLSTENGLVNNFIYSLLSDHRERYWCSSNQGISCIDLKNKEITNFGIINGIQSSEFNSGAFTEGPGGLMVMGGIRGFNLFYPDMIQDIKASCKIVLTSLSMNEVPLDPDYIGLPTATTYEHKSNNWWFEVSTLDYALPSSMQYSFFLEGYDDDWINTGSHNSIRYLHLPPGKYKLFARTAIANNQWGPAVSLFQFTILKPVYMRWWFINLMVILFIIIIFFVSRMYLRNKYLVQIHTLEKEKAVQGERLRISKDMHDDIGTGISQIAILSELAKKTSHIPETRQTVLDKISNVAGELIDNISNMIWITKPEYDNLESLVYYMREYAGSLFETTGINLHFRSPDNIPAVPLNNQVRRNIFLIFKETLNNILKHSEALSVKVNIENRKDGIYFIIEDDGIGFNPESKTSKGDGLDNMKKRATGSISNYSLQSAPGKGTRIEFCYNFKIT